MVGLVDWFRGVWREGLRLLSLRNRYRRRCLCLVLPPRPHQPRYLHVPPQPLLQRLARLQPRRPQLLLRPPLRLLQTKTEVTGRGLISRHTARRATRAEIPSPYFARQSDAHPEVTSRNCSASVATIKGRGGALCRTGDLAFCKRILRQFEKPRHSPHLSQKMRIMAAMPQFPARESNKQREMILCQIIRIAPFAGIS